MTTANHLDFVTPAAALEAYHDACRTTAPGDFETAAHALAAVIGRGRRLTPPPAPGLRLVVSNPSGQSAPAGPNPPAQSA